MHVAVAAAKSLQSCPTLCDHTGVGCYFLLQCMEVKSESKVAQSCPILRDPMDCSPPGSSVHGIFQARVLEWFAIAFSVSHSYLKNSALTYLLIEYLLRIWFYSTKYGQFSKMEESEKKSCWLFCQVTYILSGVWKKNSAIHIAGSQHRKSRIPHMLTK